METELADAFSVNATQLATAVGLYLMVYSPMQLLVGPLFDRYGARRLIVFAAFVLALSCLLPVVPCTHLGFFSAGRALMGFASSFGFVGVMYLCAVWFPPSRLALLSGLTTSVGMIGAIAGQNLLAGVVNQCGWEKTWYLCAYAGVIVTILVVYFVPKSPRGVNEKSPSQRWSTFFKNLAAVLKNKQTWIVGFGAGCLFMPLSVFADLWSIPYLMTLGITKTQAVHVVAMLYLGWTVGAPVAGFLSDYKKTRKKPLLWSSAACFVLSTLFILCNSSSVYILGACLFLLGLLSGGQVIAFVASVELNDPSTKGTAVSGVNMMTMLLGGVVQTLVGHILDLVDNPTTTHHIYSSSSYRVGFGILPLALFINTCIVAFGMRECYANGR
jgi:MFS family permease